MKLDDLVQEHYEHMSASDRLIWQYISCHKEDCRTMTIHQLADASHCRNTAAVIYGLPDGTGHKELKILFVISPLLPGKGIASLPAWKMPPLLNRSNPGRFRSEPLPLDPAPFLSQAPNYNPSDNCDPE